ITEADVRNLHQLVMRRSSPEDAGRYATLPRYVRTEDGRRDFPSPSEVPALMTDFATWLTAGSNDPVLAFAAHRKLVEIHPFNDGNGRTARLLMNLILIRAGYPPVAVRPQDRSQYLTALQKDNTATFNTFFYERLGETLSEYLEILRPIS